MKVDQFTPNVISIAQQAVSNWTIARGLTTEMMELRLEGEHHPVPAPGLLTLMGKIDEHLYACTEASELAVMIKRNAELGEGSRESLSKAAHECLYRGNMVRVTLRQIAQLALGVSAQLHTSDRVERLDRMATAALVPPNGGGVSLYDDGIEIPPVDNDGLLVLLSGLLCRMLLEGWIAVEFGSVVVGVDGEGTLRLDGGERTSAHESPVQVSSAAFELLELLEQDLHTDSIGRVIVPTPVLRSFTG